MIELAFGRRIHHNRQREITQGLPIPESTQAVAQVVDVLLFRVIPQNIPGIHFRGIVPNLRYETGLCHVVVPAALGSFFAGRAGSERGPLRYHVKVPGDLKELIKHERPGLANCLFHREDADDMIAHT